MRRTDHQLLGPPYLGIWAKQDGKRVKYDSENTGYGLRLDASADAYVSAQPTSCEIKRPPKP